MKTYSDAPCFLYLKQTEYQDSPTTIAIFLLELLHHAFVKTHKSYLKVLGA